MVEEDLVLPEVNGGTSDAAGSTHVRGGERIFRRSGFRMFPLTLNNGPWSIEISLRTAERAS